MGLRELSDVLFPGIELRIERVHVASRILFVDAVGSGPPGRCPDCGNGARRVHSRYWRRLADQPVGGREVLVRLRVRRFLCEMPMCRRRTFVEQVEGFTRSHGQSSVAMRDLIRFVAMQLGGRPGERLCRRLALSGRRTSLIRLLSAPEVPARAPRVLGVDDFAFRRGHTYGTVLVDVERGKPFDVLPDRSSETFLAWLEAHPGAEVICRDRATGYTRAIKQAATGAIEVADRWHLMQNLSVVVEKTCHQHRACLRKHAQERAQPDAPVPDTWVPDQPATLPKTAIVERTLHRHADILDLVDKGWTISAIARRLDMDRKTVRHFRDTDLAVLIESARHRRTGLLTPFHSYLQARFLNGCTDASRLFREVRERGFGGTVQTVRRYVATLRDGTAIPAPTPIPSPRAITSWIMRRRESLSEDDEVQLGEVCLACPDIARAREIAERFTALVRDRTGHLLPDWISDVERDAPQPIRGFARFMKFDIDAVTAGLTLQYSSGVVEGHVNRIKMLSSSRGHHSPRLSRNRT
ncbi:ISL3 family transposase [Streptomyces lavendulae]|uniref:ISL3 family transposase n=1 Tax=Streptomyces lavendulae TaxID=1914 RepID=UPI0025558544|nr:ISL3 family transposase [Streptomyces lavendulae]